MLINVRHERREAEGAQALNVQGACFRHKTVVRCSSARRLVRHRSLLEAQATDHAVAFCSHLVLGVYWKFLELSLIGNIRI